MWGLALGSLGGRNRKRRRRSWLAWKLGLGGGREVMSMGMEVEVTTEEEEDGGCLGEGEERRRNK